ncbi:MAG TPA: DUF4268 domain-containing protein [Puia sp.]|nr:DUF4268 domain-containing protein [Puia sp.]
MYTKQEISKQKQAFWTAFGRYMKPVLSADGEEISWLNYKTGNKHINFKMDVDSRQVQIAIVLHHDDSDMQQLYYDRFVQLKDIFYETVGEDDWTWMSVAMDEYGRHISVIQKRLTGVNMFKNEDWPAIISFLKPRIIALDAFWSMARYQFSNL